MNNTKYSALCCYFGKWPDHFSLWLKSCVYNSDITFFMITDISTVEYSIPKNVIIIDMSFEELQELIRNKFPELLISIERPYKICDFRPAFAYIFEDVFSGYDYWGWYDIDTIWGDICSFIPENTDNHLKKIFPCGHLSFVRNSDVCNQMYKETGKYSDLSDWKFVFTHPESFFFDEVGGFDPMFNRARDKEYTYFGSTVFDNVLPPWKFDHFNSINNTRKNRCLLFSFEEGKLYSLFIDGLKVKREEIAYLHLSRRYMKIKTSLHEKFLIQPNEYSDYREVGFWDVLYNGRPRYIKNIYKRLIAKIKKYG